MQPLLYLAAVIAMQSLPNLVSAQQDQRQDRGAQERAARGQQRSGKGERGGQSQQRGRGGQRGGGEQGGGGGLFRLLDADRDGNLSAHEIDGAVAALTKLDANDDGVLEAQELVVRGGQGRGGQGGERGKRGVGRGDQQRVDGPPRREQAAQAADLPSRTKQPPRKPRISDTIKANVYADNSFKLYVNGELVAVDPIGFVPHNVVSVDLLPAYPMTIAAMGIDNADPKTGMEYANTNIGDGGFILKFGDGTMTNATWKAKKFSWGPIDGDMKNPRVENIPVPKDWYAIGFDDSKWPNAREFTEEEVGPKEPFFEHDFEGAKFIWSDDVKLDNLVLFRTVVNSPPDDAERPDFRGLTDVVPQGGGRRGGGAGQGRGGQSRGGEARGGQGGNRGQRGQD